MIDKNHEHTNQELPSSEHNEIDRALDVALAKYAAVDPRPGLEERVLAHLRTAPEPHIWMAARLWTAAGFAIITVAIAVGLAMQWRSITHPHTNIANHPPAPSQPQSQPEIRGAANYPSETQNSKPVSKRVVHRTHTEPEIAVAPKLPRLDQFPSLQPLSDQEKLLAGYIAQDPERAALLAELRMDALRRDAEEHRRLALQDSQQLKENE